MKQNQLNKVLEQQNWLKANADIELWCKINNSTEYEFWTKNLWNYVLFKYGIKSSLGIGDSDLSEGVIFEDD